MQQVMHITATVPCSITVMDRNRCQNQRQPDLAKSSIVMISGPRGIDLALDLARMPALAQSIEEPPLPTDISDVMRIAAGSPETCQSASQATGQPPAVLIQAARFYVQQVLLRPDADSYRVLGLPPGASRELARRHMRCLLQWLHPDVNRDWDSAYAERVLSAWREVSANISDPSN